MPQVTYKKKPTTKATPAAASQPEKTAASLMLRGGRAWRTRPQSAAKNARTAPQAATHFGSIARHAALKVSLTRVLMRSHCEGGASTSLSSGSPAARKKAGGKSPLSAGVLAGALGGGAVISGSDGSGVACSNAAGSDVSDGSDGSPASACGGVASSGRSAGGSLPGLFGSFSSATPAYLRALT